MHPIITAEIDRSLLQFQQILGGCEKLLRTPIYTPYTRFTSRFLYMWCNALPLAMFPLVGPLGTAPVSLIISFFLLGIEDIGSRVENPYDVLPLWQYCQVVDSSIEQMLRHSEVLNQTTQSMEIADEFLDMPEENLHSYVDPL